MNIKELNQKIQDAGYRVIRREQTHYVVDNGEKRVVIWISHKGDQPRAVVEQIYKKLGITGEEKSVSKFFKKREGKLAPFGTYGYELYAARESKRMSAMDVGKAVGLSGSAIILYESNKGTPKPEI